MRVVFMGTPEFSVPALNALAARHEVVCVYCQPPRPAGRGKQPRPCAVQRRAEELDLAVRHPVTLKTAEAQAEFAALNADIAVVVAYGLLLPRPILDAPRKGCLNIHASLLPRWRGAAPLHRAIMAGDEITGICIMQMDAGLDTGPVLLRRETPIRPHETTGQLHDRLREMGADLILTALQEYDQLQAIPQREQGITYAHKIDKTESAIDWQRPAPEIMRQIHALAPFPGAWCMIGGERVKFLGAELAPHHAMPGQVLDNFTIACGQGSLKITLAQREGKKPLPPNDFLRGFSLPPSL